MKQTARQKETNALPIRTINRFKLIKEATGITIPNELHKIERATDSQAVFKAIHSEHGNDFQESFYVLFLNRTNKITGYYHASTGGMTTTVADPRLIFKAALLCDCVSIMLCHNHPSGNTRPSHPDIQLTRKIKDAGLLLDIKVIDHVIITEGEDYYSFAEEGEI